MQAHVSLGPGNVRELDHTIERAVLMAETARGEHTTWDLGTGANGATPLDQNELEDVERCSLRSAGARVRERE